MSPRPTSRCRLLALSVASALAVPVVLVAPVVTAPTAAPHPVKPKLQRFAVTGVDTAAEMSLGDGTGSTARTAGPGRRLAVLTSQRATAPFRLVGLTWTGTAPASM